MLPARPAHAHVSEIGLLEFGHVKVEEYCIDESPILHGDVRIELLFNVVVDLVENRLHPQHAAHEVEQVGKKEVGHVALEDEVAVKHEIYEGLIGNVAGKQRSREISCDDLANVH